MVGIKAMEAQFKSNNTGTSNPAGINLLKVNNRNTKTRCDIGSKLIIKTPGQRPMASFWGLYY